MVASLAWGGYSNGYIPDSAMTDIGRGFKLERGAALQFFAARAFLLLTAGIDLLDYISETYRDYAGQIYQRQRWTALGKPWNAADPGGSIHGWAKAIDWNADALNEDGIYVLVMTVLARYGFIRDVDGESWHTSFREAQIEVHADATTITNLEEEIDMSAEANILAAIQDVKDWLLGGAVQWILVRDTDTGDIFAMAPGNVVKVPTPDHLHLFQKRGIFPPKVLELPHNEAEWIRAFYGTAEANDDQAVKLLQLISQDTAKALLSSAP